MSLVTLASLRQQARNRSDMRINGIFSDADFNAAINQSIYELNDLLIKSWGDAYFLTSSVTPLQPGVSTYPLPTGMYKLAGIDWQSATGNPWLTLHSFEFADRNKQANANPVTSQSRTNMRYCLAGSNVLLLPTPQAGQQVQFWYVPQPSLLVNDSDTYDFIGGWEEFVIVNTAIKALAAEESDTSVFMAQKAEMKDRIMDMAPKRDQGEPHAIVDVETSDDWW